MGICNSSTKEDVKRDRERTRPGGQQQQQGGTTTSSSNPQQTQQQARGVPGQPGTQIPKSSGPGGIPAGSYRDANGIPRSLAVDQPIAASYKGGSYDDARGKVGSGAYGTSYTNRKTKEYDLLNDIVKQTRNNFIDVSAKSGQLDEDDLIERGQKYVKNLSEIPSNMMATTAPPASSNSFGIYYNALELPTPSSLIVKRTPNTNTTTSSHLSTGLAQARLNMTGEIDYSALINILTTATIQPQDTEFISMASAQIASAIMDSTTIQDPPPKIVLTFEELLNDK